MTRDKGPQITEQDLDALAHDYAKVGENHQIVELVAEVRRLRGLIKDVEWASWDGVVGNGICPWCEIETRAASWRHASFCPAFNEDGSVK